MHWGLKQGGENKGAVEGMADFSWQVGRAEMVW